MYTEHLNDQQTYRRLSASSAASSWSSCEALILSSRRQSISVRSCGAMSAEGTRDLWRCMLELQSRYGCYTSARIDAAMAAGEHSVGLMPTRFVIDTLNESVVDILPQEGLEMLNNHLRQGDSSAGSP